MIIDARTQAVRNLYDNVVTIDGDDAFDKDHKKITLDEGAIDTEIKRIEKEFSDNHYQRDRKADYPSYAEQFDLLYHNGISGLKAELKKTKDKFPKP